MTKREKAIRRPLLAEIRQLKKSMQLSHEYYRENENAYRADIYELRKSLKRVLDSAVGTKPWMDARNALGRNQSKPDAAKVQPIEGFGPTPPKGIQ